MTHSEIRHKLDSCNTPEEAAVLMREYYNCHESHTKAKTWVCIPLPTALGAQEEGDEPPHMQLQCQAYFDIACLDCMNKKKAPYEDRD